MENLQEIFTDKIKLPADNMREHINRDEIFELAEDIKKNGLISPITVRPIYFCISCGNTPTQKCIDEDGHNVDCSFELVAGQRRYLAHQVAGIIKIKCIVKKLSDDEAFAIMTSENLARVDVNPVDEAKHIGRLMEKNNFDIYATMKIVGRSKSWIEDRLAVASMPDYMQEFLANKQIKLGVALVLNEITDENTRRMWTEQAVRDGVTVAMAEYWLADFKRQLLPGGTLATSSDEQINIVPPQAIMFRCGLDGQEYDCRLCKTVIIYEGNLPIFRELVSAFNEAPSEI